MPEEAPVKLWWASPQVPGGAHCRLRTKRDRGDVTAQREDGKEGVLATWEWAGGRISHWVDTPGWSVVQASIHQDRSLFVLRQRDPKADLFIGG